MQYIVSQSVSSANFCPHRFHHSNLMGKSRQQYDGGHYSRRGYSKDDLYKGPGAILMQLSMMVECIWELH